MFKDSIDHEAAASFFRSLGIWTLQTLPVFEKAISCAFKALISTVGYPRFTSKEYRGSWNGAVKERNIAESEQKLSSKKVSNKREK